MSLRPPALALQRLLSRQQAEFAAHQAEVAATQSAAEALIAECADLVAPWAGIDSELLEGAEAIRERLAELGRTVRHEVMTCPRWRAQR